MLDQTALCDKMTGFEMRGGKWLSLTQTLAMFSAVSPARFCVPAGISNLEFGSPDMLITYWRFGLRVWQLRSSKVVQFPS